MSLLTGIEAWWRTTEADVLAAIVGMKSGIEVVENDILKALSWVNSNIPAINADIAEINGALKTIVGSGIVTIPDNIHAAIADANRAVAALNAYQATVAAGGSQTTALVAGYTAIKSAQSATALATLAVVNAPAPVTQ